MPAENRDSRLTGTEVHRDLRKIKGGVREDLNTRFGALLLIGGECAKPMLNPRGDLGEGIGGSVPRGLSHEDNTSSL